MRESYLPTTSSPSSTADKQENVICCRRFGRELRHPAFAAEEISGHVLHGPNTFAPSGKLVLAVKLLLLAWATSVLVTAVLDYEIPFYYWAYLTNLTLTVSILYLLTSWLQTVGSTLFRRRRYDNLNDKVTWSHKITWALFAVAAPAEIVVALGYWGLEYDSHSDVITYRNIFVHGLIVPIVLVDGLLLNRIPLRTRHFGLLIGYAFTYLIWTLIYEFTGLGDGTEYAVLYKMLEWQDNTWLTLKAAGILLLIVAPLAFVIVYSLSLYSFPCGCRGTGRRYISTSQYNMINNKQTNGDPSTPYVEMKTMKATV